MTPRTYAQFTIVRKLPAGGMGRVYEALDPGQGRRIALKLIDRGTDPDSLEIVKAERHGALLQKQLCSLDPRITAVYEFGEDPEYFFIIMEYVEGQDLSELTAQKTIGYPFAARIAQDVLEVLDHAHNFRTRIENREYQGIIHGDIKPRNIRLTTVGQVKVLDFGIAKALSLTHRFTQNVFGSVQYSSPERLNTGEVTISSDLWSVAVVLYELVARRPYFEADTGPRLEHLVRNYREVRPLPEECPEELKFILRRALDPNPDVRYPTAEEFAADLRAYRTGQLAATPAADIEATRRTSRAAYNGDLETRRTDGGTVTADVEATRRTARESPARPAPPVLPPSKTGPAPKRRRVRWGRIALVLFLVCGAFVGYLFMNEYLVWRDAHELTNQLESERLQQIDAAWKRYQEIAARSNAGWTLWSAQDALRDRLAKDADHVITEYRNSDAPTVSENDWSRARASVAKALELAPRDKNARGKLRLIDGHLNRIRGTARRDPKLMQTARENFEEAAQLMPKSPDPWLGLARLYVYGFHDIDRAEDALKQSEHHGHDIGKRETAQLADGYRDRAERTLREAERAGGRPEEERLLDLARKDFEHSRKLYESILPFGGATANLRRTYDGLDRIEELRSQPAPEQHD